MTTIRNREIKQNEAVLPGIRWEDDIIPVYEPNDGGVWYPRLYTLKSGVMICAFDTNEDGETVIKTLYSSDGGLTWGNKTTVTDLPELQCANASIIEMDNGEIWIAYRANGDKAGGYYSSLRVSVSGDGGVTWKTHSLIDEELGVGGVYEPHFGWIDDKLAVFYANDSRNVVNKHMEQNIEFKIWDGADWSNKYIASDGTATHSRDGMPVWASMDGGGYVLVVEATNEQGYPFVIQMKTSPDGYDWSQPLKNIYIPKAKTKKAGAPYVVVLPDGRLCVSLQTDDGAVQTGDHASYMKVMVSLDKYGTEFSDAYVPFYVPDGYCANWNALHVNGDILFAVTSANYPRSGIYLRRAKLVEME